MSGKSKRVLLGHFSGAHGIGGDVIVRSFTGEPTAIGDYGVLSSKDGARSFKITVKRDTKKGVIVRVEGVCDRNGAEALKGIELYVLREQLGEAADGAFFYSDLIGLAAFGEDGVKLGEVIAVENFGAGDLLEVRFMANGKTEYISFTHEFVPVVDIDAGRVVIVVPAEDEDDGKGDGKRKAKGKG